MYKRASKYPANTLPTHASNDIRRDHAKLDRCRRRDCAHGDAIDDQRAGVVEQAFAFEDTSMRCGRRSRRKIALAAAASGGATMAPSAIAAAQGMSGTSACRHATATVVMPTAAITSK